jgi:hypothetical protein
MAQGMGVCGDRHRPRVPVPVAEDVDRVVVHRARASQWRCLGGCWCRGEQVGEEKEAGDGRRRRARVCTVVAVA